MSSIQEAEKVSLGERTRRGLPFFKKRKKNLRQHNLVGYMFISPWLIGFFVFGLIPIAASLVLSFTRYNILSPPRWAGTANYVEMFTQDRRYWLSIRATFYYVFTAVPLRLIFALIVAMILNTGRRLVSVYRAAYYTPSIVGGSIAVAVMWREIWGSDRLVNSLLALIGIQGPNWLGNPRMAIWILILLAVWQFGSPMLIFLAGLRQIPQEFYEAAAIDGAGPWAKFLKITLPMLTPIILFNLVMQMISGFQVFIQAFIVTSGGPLNTTLFYNLYLYRKAYDLLHMGYAAAMAWMLLVLIAVFTALVFKSTPYWVYYESEEGR